MACFELYQLFGTIITRLLISRSGYRRRVVRTSPRTRAQCSLRSVPCFVRRNNERARSLLLLLLQPDDDRRSAPTYARTYLLFPFLLPFFSLFDKLGPYHFQLFHPSRIVIFAPKYRVVPASSFLQAFYHARVCDINI